MRWYRPKMQTEQWRPVVGYEGWYEVSDHGRVRSVERTVEDRFRGGVRLRRYEQKVLALTERPSGYKVAHLRRNSTRKMASVHRMVLEAFVGPCPEGMECLHGPGGASDNRLENLRWGTHQENMDDLPRDGGHYKSRQDACANGHRYVEGSYRLYTPPGRKNPRRMCRVCDQERNRRRLSDGRGPS